MRERHELTRRISLSLSLFSFFTCALAAFSSGCRQPAPLAAAAAAPQPPFEYLGAWGSRGIGPGQMEAPVGIAADSTGNVYLADAASGFVNKFSVNGEPRLSFQDDRVNLHAVSIAADEGGGIYVADGRHGSVIIYFPEGKRYRELRVGATKGVRESLRVAVGADGALYVAGKRPFGVRKYTPRGRLAGLWRGSAARGEALDEPAGIAAAPDGLVYVAEAARALIRVYQQDGTMTRTLTVPGENAQFAGVAVNGRFVFAADPRNRALHVWSSDGSYRLREDLSPWISGAAASPVAVAITPRGECLVLDRASARVLRFRLHF